MERNDGRKRKRQPGEFRFVRRLKRGVLVVTVRGKRHEIPIPGQSTVVQQLELDNRHHKD